MNEELGLHVERDKIQSLDMNIVNMTAESLYFWFTKFVERLCKEDGDGMLSLLFVGQFCIFATFCNGQKCDEDD